MNADVKTSLPNDPMKRKQKDERERIILRCRRAQHGLQHLCMTHQLTPELHREAAELESAMDRFYDNAMAQAR